MNLDKIKEISENDVLHDYFDRNMIVSMTAAQEGWEFLELYKNADGTNGVIVHPVIAWGVTILGNVVSITPDELSIGDLHALRYKDKIYVDGEIFNTLQEWLDAVPK